MNIEIKKNTEELVRFTDIKVGDVFYDTFNHHYCLKIYPFYGADDEEINAVALIDSDGCPLYDTEYFDYEDFVKPVKSDLIIKD